MVGGTKFDYNRINLVTEMPRQIASLAKIFIYQTAFENKFKITDKLIDEKIYVKDHQINNYDKKYHGELNLFDAFQKSNNTIPIKLINNIGIDKVLKKFEDYSIPAINNPLIALGISEVPLIKINHAYCYVYNNLKSDNPVYIRKITDKKDKIIEQFDLKLEPKMDSKVHQNLMTLLKRYSCGSNFYAKTGTTSDSRDFYLVTYNEEDTISAWFGNLNNKPLTNVINQNLSLICNYNYALKNIDYQISKNEEAFLDTVSFMMGTFSSKGYDYISNSNNFPCWLKYEPSDFIPIAGRYKMNKNLWKTIKDKKKLANFIPLNQDIAALDYIYSKFDQDDINNFNTEIFNLFDNNNKKDKKILKKFYNHRLYQLNNYYY